MGGSSWNSVKQEAQIWPGLASSQSCLHSFCEMDPMRVISREAGCGCPSSRQYRLRTQEETGYREKAPTLLPPLGSLPHPALCRPMYLSSTQHIRSLIVVCVRKDTPSLLSRSSAQHCQTHTWHQWGQLLRVGTGNKEGPLSSQHPFCCRATHLHWVRGLIREQ